MTDDWMTPEHKAAALEGFMGNPVAKAYARAMAEVVQGPNLAEWLLEQIAEDERAAVRLDSGWWEVDSDHAETYDAIQRFADKARVLAECDAKRRHIAWLLDVQKVAARPAESTDDAYIFAAGLADKGLKMLALPYADRPGYREGWRP